MLLLFDLSYLRLKLKTKLNLKMDNVEPIYFTREKSESNEISGNFHKPVNELRCEVKIHPPVYTKPLIPKELQMNVQ